MGRRGNAKSGKAAARRPVRLEMSAGGVVYRPGPEGALYLLIRDPYQNWGLPKGHIERGESPADAARREVREETGLDELDVMGELETIDWFFREGPDLIHKYCRFYLMRTDEEETRPQVDEGITDCVWLPLEDALSRVTYDNARTVLADAGTRVIELERDRVTD